MGRPFLIFYTTSMPSPPLFFIPPFPYEKKTKMCFLGVCIGVVECARERGERETLKTQPNLCFSSSAPKNIMPRPAHPPPAGHDESLPCPRAHALLAVLAAAPLALPVPANFNVIATAAAAVYVGCWRSVKAAGPTESMTKKVGGVWRGWGGGWEAARGSRCARIRNDGRAIGRSGGAPVSPTHRRDKTACLWCACSTTGEHEAWCVCVWTSPYSTHPRSFPPPPPNTHTRTP